jgi:hypothetical protein
MVTYVHTELSEPVMYTVSLVAAIDNK